MSASTAILAAAVLATATMVSGAHGQGLYKHVDKNGNVTFSSAPTKPGFEKTDTGPARGGGQHFGKRGDQPHPAAHRTKSSDLKQFVAEGGDINEPDDSGYTALHVALRSNDTERVQLLVEAGAKVNVGTVNGSTPLHLAAFWDRTDAALFLIDSGADVNAVDWDDNTPLHKADQLKIVRALISKGAYVNKKNRFGVTPLKSGIKPPDVEDYIRKHGGRE